jgi:hypothetical protein
MAPPVVTLSFSVQQQMEIAEIVMDGDPAAALELVKTLQRELRAREQGTCGSIFQPPRDETSADPINDANTEDTEHHT